MSSFFDTALREELRKEYRKLVVSGTRTIYVVGTGSDSAAGTQGSPYATIQRAIDGAVAGDRILVGNGTYGYSQLYGKNGAQTAWISIEALPGASPTIDVSSATHASGDGMDIQLSTFIGVFGLEIKALQTQSNSDASGIGIFRQSHHIVTWANHVHDFPGGGINHFFIGPDDTYSLPSGGWDLVDCSYNEIHACSKNSVYNTSGISFYGAVDYTKTTWDGKYGYRAVGNYIYDCICTKPYSPGGFTEVTDGNGISVDSLAVANNLYPELIAYVKYGLCESNIINACGGRAIHTYNSINLDARFNTAIGNLRTVSGPISGSCEFDLQLDQSFPQPNVRYVGNVIMPLNTPNTTDSDAIFTDNIICGGTQAVPANNIDKRSSLLGYFTGIITQQSLIDGLPLSTFTPAVVDLVANAVALSSKRTVLNTAFRPGRGTWTAGALEIAVVPKYLKKVVA